MRVSLNLTPAKGCQPLKFGKDNNPNANKNVTFTNNSTAQKQVDANLVIALQNMAIHNLTNQLETAKKA